MEDFVEFLLFELYIYYLYSQYYKQTPFLITVIEIEFNFAIEVYVHVVYNLKTKSKIFKNYFLYFIIFDFNGRFCRIFIIRITYIISICNTINRCLFLSQ